MSVIIPAFLLLIVEPKRRCLIDIICLNPFTHFKSVAYLIVIINNKLIDIMNVFVIKTI